MRAAATVGAFTVGGQVSGYARHVAVAAVLGAGPLADAFFLALRVPGLVSRLFAGRGVGAVFIPMFTRRLARSGAIPARAFAGEVLSFTAAALAVLTAGLELAAPWLVPLLAPGFAGEAGQAALTAGLLRILLPFMVFAALAQLLGGMLNGLGRFAAAAAMPTVFNLVVIAALLAFARGSGTPAHVLAWAIAAAGAAQLAFLALACRRAGVFPAPGPMLPSRRVRRLMRRAAPAVAGAGAAQAIPLTDLALATLLPAGSVSFLYYGERVARLLPSVVGAAAATVLLPHLSRRGGRGAAAGRHDANRTLEAVVLLGLPGGVALAIIAEPLLAALLQRGAFGADAVAGTAAALAAYAGAVPAWMLSRSLAAVSFARGDAGTPMRAALAAAALNLVLSLALMAPLGHVGIALGTTVAVWAQTALLARALVRRGALAPDRRLYRRAGAAAVASTVMAGALWCVRLWLGESAEAGELERIARLAALVAAGLGCYALAAHATGALRWRELAGRPGGKS